MKADIWTALDAQTYVFLVELIYQEKVERANPISRPMVSEKHAKKAFKIAKKGDLSVLLLTEVYTYIIVSVLKRSLPLREDCREFSIKQYVYIQVVLLLISNSSHAQLIVENNDAGCSLWSFISQALQ